MHGFLPIVIDLSWITLESRFCPVGTNNFLFAFVIRSDPGCEDMKK